MRVLCNLCHVGMMKVHRVHVSIVVIRLNRKFCFSSESSNAVQTPGSLEYLMKIICFSLVINNLKLIFHLVRIVLFFFHQSAMNLKIRAFLEAFVIL